MRDPKLDETLPSLGVLGVEDDRLHAAACENPVGVANQTVKVLFISWGYGIFAFLPVRDPAVLSPHEVGAEDDSGVVILESMGGVDAADLPETGPVSCPEARRGIPLTSFSALEFHGRCQSPMRTSFSRLPSGLSSCSMASSIPLLVAVPSGPTTALC